MERAHVVKNDDEGELLGLMKLVHRETLHFYSTEFTHCMVYFIWVLICFIWMYYVRYVGAKLVKIMDKLLLDGCFVGESVWFVLLI